MTTVLDIFLYQALAFLLLRLLVVLGNLWFFPVLRNTQAPIQQKVSLLIPVRNEAQTLPETLPKLLAQPADEILLLDDRSEDQTTQIALEIATNDPRFRLISGEPLPQGWLGKNWACHQLAQAASGELLVFTDADVYWERGALQSVLANLEGVGLVSVFPRQHTHSLIERVLVGLVDVTLLCNIPYFLIKSRSGLGSAANGQVMAFSRASYEACGGHAAVRAEVLEDVRLAQAIKRAGKRLKLLLGDGLIGVRMYRSYQAIVEGFGKNLPSFHLDSRVVLVISMLGHIVLYNGAWVLGFINPLWWVVGGMGLLERILTNLKTGRELWEVVLVPLAPLLSVPIYLQAMRRKFSWKGRVYSR